MKKSAFLVNVARGGLVDDDALIAALESREIGGAVLDAFREEPVEAGHPLWGRPDVLALPHVTWSSAHTLDDFKWRFAAQTGEMAGRGNTRRPRRSRRRVLTDGVTA